MKKPVVEIISVSAENVESSGFFCYMSKKKSEGFGRKLDWLNKRFSEGMRIKLLKLPERGFIEYIPGEHAWRAIHADGYLVIHCLWVVGKSKGKGLAGSLLDACLADAKRSGMKGVAMVTSEKVWLAGRRILDRHGFECVDTAPPAFSLMVKTLGKHPRLRQRPDGSPLGPVPLYRRCDPGRAGGRDGRRSSEPRRRAQEPR